MKSKKIHKYRKDQRYFAEKEKIEKYLTCPICQDIFDDPFRVTCGHTFCKNCLNQWEKKSKNSLCPLCREYYHKDFSGKDLIAQSMINDSIVTCIYKGCPWKDKLFNLQNHIQTCLFEPGKLPKFMKQTDFFHPNLKKGKNKEKEEEDDEEDIGNICSFNFSSSIKERVFARDPSLVQKLFGQENKEKEEDEKKLKKNIERISENDDVNDLYNCLLFDNQKTESKYKINIINSKEKENFNDKKKENINENEQNLQGSSIMNIFINPNITVAPNTFLSKKTEREDK